MSLLNLILILIVVFLKKIENSEGIRLLKRNLWIGGIYWLSIIIGSSFLKISPETLGYKALVAELLVKLYTTYLFYQISKLASKSSGKTWLYCMIAVGLVDIVAVVVVSMP
ncbi:MAG: hypothetical protein NTX25_23090 [Proteobacteria bacterium]|nr:hypothetical protein [Pseudomonadota bacterium]